MTDCRIVIYTDDPGEGGVAAYNHAIMCGLVEAGYELGCVQSRSDNPLVKHQEALGIRHHWLEFDTRADIGRGWTGHADAERALAALVPDLVLFTNCSPFSHIASKEVCVQQNIPFIIVEGFVAPFGETPTLSRLLAKIQEHYRQAKEVVAVSKENLSLLREQYGLPSNKGKVIHYGRPAAYFEPPSPETRRRVRREHGIPAEAVLCLTVARLAPIKGYELQIAALEQLRHSEVWPQIYFAWIGGGPETALRNVLAQKGLADHVRVLGQRWDVPDWLDAADLFLLPSFREGMPLSIMEAMAKGLPVVASAVSGIPEELGQTGRLLPSPEQDSSATINEIARTIEFWTRDGEQRSLVGLACRRRAESLFREARMIRETIDVIECSRLPEKDRVSRGQTAVRPDRAKAQYDLGNSLLIAGRTAEAVDHLRQALKLQPDYAEAHDCLGRCLWQQEQFETAIEHFRRAVQLKPGLAALHCNLGGALHQQGKLDEGIECYRRAVALDPSLAAALSNLGNALREKRQLDEAVACCRRAIEIRPDFAGAHNNLGNALRELGQTNGDRTIEAVESYRRALRAEPNYTEVHNNLGIALLDLGNQTEAVECFRRALNLKPSYYEAHCNLAKAFRDRGDLEQAAECYRRALQLKPDWAEAHAGLADTLTGLGNLAQAAACYQRALQINPDLAEAHLGFGMLLLRQGDLRQGWQEYQWRWKTGQSAFIDRGFQQPEWNGRQLSGETILIYAEQGLGDTIQFARYAPLLKARGARVIVQCQAGLTRLLSSAEGIDEVITWGEALPPFDERVAMLSLPRIFDTSLETIPAKEKYLSADPALVAKWRPALSTDNRFKVGIAWQCNPGNDPVPRRSFPVDQLLSLARLAGVSLYSLQKGPAAAELEKLCDALPVIDLTGEITDFADTAAIMSHLDLVISCDTSVAHLAGALGIPTWVALPYSAPWRWFCDREDSPWYPSVRLFRQQRAGEWGEVFERIAQALQELVNGGQPSRSRRLDAEGHYKLGNALAAQGKFEKAEACYRSALELSGNFVQAQHNLGSALMKQGKLDEAARCYRRALELKPDYPDAYHNLGTALRDQGQVDEAMACYQRAIELAPQNADAHWNQSLLKLLRGDFETGWQEYEWRWRTGMKQFVSRNIRQPLWDGQELDGKTILLHPEQGLGDTIQFIRFAPLVKARGGRVIVKCQRELTRLLRSCAGIDELFDDEPTLPSFDVHVPLLSLPGLLGTRLETIPAELPYLRADDRLAEQWSGKLPKNGQFKIGIVWQSNPANLQLRARSYPLELFRSLARLSGLSLYSLQMGPARADLKACADLAVTDLSEQIADFADTAAIVSQLDLVISCDTAVVHLAGALGRPVWVALPFAPDWRWLLEREDSPWYPTMRLFRQQKAGEWAEVFQRISRALEELLGSAGSGPDGGPAHQPVAEPFAKQGGVDESIGRHPQAIQLKTDDARDYHNLGGVLQRRGKLDEAIDCYHRALELQPDLVEAQRDLSEALTKQGKFELAACSLRRVVELSPNDAGAHGKLSYVLRKLERFADAERCCRTALELRPDDFAAHCELAEALWDHGKVAEAAGSFRQALAIAPHSAGAHYNLAAALQAINQLDEAEACYERALRINENLALARLGRGHVRLRRGDWLAGWRDYEWRRKTNLPAFAGGEFDGPAWDGTPLAGKTILLYCEQGLGDTIQFVRYAPILKRQGAQVWLRCQAELLKLLNGAHGIDRLFSAGEPLPSVDERVALMSLPNRMGTTIETVPNETPYLDVNPDRVEKWRAIMRAEEAVGRFKIGIVWQSNPANLRARSRSFPLEQFQTISQCCDVLLYSLQKGPASAALKARGACFPVIDLGSQIGDFEDTAAILSHLDLVISCDTAVAHLAGALGRPVWVALPYAADWRWLLEREDSPWYPTMRLFRQCEPGNWDEVFARIASALSAEVG